MILNYMPRKFELEAVVVYCFNECNQLVLLKKQLDDKLYPGLWGTIAGKKKPWENMFEASRREVMEETGNEIDPRSLIYLNKSFPTCHCVHKTGKPITFLAHMILCLQTLDTINISDEHSKHYWVDGFDILADKFNLIPDAFDNFVECLPLIKRHKNIKT